MDNVELTLAEQLVVERSDHSTPGLILPLEAQVGSLLFVSIKPIAVSTIAEVLQVTVEVVEEAITNLKEIFQDQLCGFSLVEVAGGYQLRTALAAAELIKRLAPARGKKLSKAAAETLAVIAYKQPVQRAEIESIRGVDALPTLKTLLDAKLIRIVGKEDSIGQPALYGTTTYFLEKFGLRDLSDLPSVREIEQLINEPGESSVEAEAESESAVEDLEEEKSE